MRRFVLFHEFNQLPLRQVSRIQQRVVTVLAAMIEVNGYDKHRACDVLPELQAMLDDIKDSGGFGSRGEHDPRGNFQEGAWSMDKVQGLRKVIGQTRVRAVLERMVDGAMRSHDYATHVGMYLDAPLDRLLRKGVWGLEGHLDPRGDRRDHNHWSMACVQGVDTPKEKVQVTTESVFGEKLQACQQKLVAGDRDGAFVDLLAAMLESSKHAGSIVREHQVSLTAMHTLLLFSKRA